MSRWRERTKERSGWTGWQLTIAGRHSGQSLRVGPWWDHYHLPVTPQRNLCSVLQQGLLLYQYLDDPCIFFVGPSGTIRALLWSTAAFCKILWHQQTKIPAVARIADCTGFIDFQVHSRSMIFISSYKMPFPISD